MQPKVSEKKEKRTVETFKRHLLSAHYLLLVSYHYVQEQDSDIKISVRCPLITIKKKRTVGTFRRHLLSISSLFVTG